MKVERKEILLIDDEAGFHELFRYLIEPLGIKFHSAYDGLQGLECSAQKDYAIIFLDIHMPKMLGTEVLGKIRAMKPRQPIVLLSSFSDPAHLLQANVGKMGVEACLEKPFDADQILSIVEKITGVLTKQ